METIVAGFSALTILVFIVFAGGMAFNILRVFTGVLVLLLTRGRANDEKTQLLSDSLAAGLVAALVFALQLARPAPH